MTPERFAEIKKEFYDLHPDDRTEDMADLIAEIERLQQEITFETLLPEFMKAAEEFPTLLRYIKQLEDKLKEEE